MASFAVQGKPGLLFIGPHIEKVSVRNFVMRCYLPNLDNRMTVIHDLHTAVDREFRAAGIEIAFPQHDVHIRSLDVPLPAMPNLTNEIARRAQGRAEASNTKAAG